MCSQQYYPGILGYSDKRGAVCMCSRHYYPGILGYSDKRRVHHACVHASTVLGSWDTLTSEVHHACVHASTVLGPWDTLTRRCSMHVFMPVLSWDGHSISGLMTWYGTTHIPLNFYAILWRHWTSSASIGPTLNGNRVDCPCVFINEGNKPCYYGNGYQDFVGYIPSYFCTQCKVILTNTI